MARRSASYMSRWSYLEAKIDWDMAKGWYNEKGSPPNVKVLVLFINHSILILLAYDQIIRSKTRQVYMLPRFLKGHKWEHCSYSETCFFFLKVALVVKQLSLKGGNNLRKHSHRY